MIGTDPNIDLPTLSDSLATIIAKLVAGMETLADSVATKATPGALNINAPLGMNGNALTNVSTVQFASGNASQAPGSIFYFGDAWYVVDATGLIQLTDNGQLNTAGVGGIVGDYGGTNPARVSYNNAAGQYEFTEDTGVWADLVADDLVLKGTNGEIRLSVDDDVSTSRDISIKSLPTSGRSLLVYDTSDSTLVDHADTQITNDLDVVNIIATEYKHRGESARLSLFPANKLTNCGQTEDPAGFGAYRLNSTGTNWAYASRSLPLKTGDRVTIVRLYLDAAVSGNISVTLYKYDHDKSLTAVDSWTFNPGTTTGLYSRTVASPSALASTEYYYFLITGAASGVSISSIGYHFDHP